jgi:hypothetical protein
VLDDLDVPLGIEMAAPNAARIFRALYPEFGLRRVDGTGHIVVPRGGPRLTGPGLGHVARQIRDHEQWRSGRAE